MRKGHRFEKQIEKVCEYVENIGGHCHKNNASRTLDGVFLVGEPFDYEIFLPGYNCVFDAKECATDTWNMQDKDIKQADNLYRCKKAGLEAYFLIFFEGKEVKQINIEKVADVLKSGSKSISKKLGTEWELLKFLKR